MRLLIVSTVSNTIRAFLLPFADHFRSLGWKVDVLAHGAEKDSVCLGHFDNVHDIEWSRSPLDGKNLLRGIRKVRRVVASGGYDIVHVHTPVAAFLTRVSLAWPLAGKRPAVIYTAHGFHFQPGNRWLRNAAFETLERIAGRWTDFLVTMNRTDGLAALRLRLVHPSRLQQMPGIGIDLIRYQAAGVSPSEVRILREKFGIADAESVFVMIAEFIPRKRHTDALAALSRMRNRTVRLILVGEGPRMDTIRRYAMELGVADRVHFAGAQSDVRPFILMARATILPSSQEGLPRSVMESLSCGVPVVGSDIRGTRDLLSDGRGLLFPVGNIDALASHLDWILENPEGTLEMALRARDSMSAYDIAKIVALHEKLYEKAINYGRFRALGGFPLRTVMLTTSPSTMRTFFGQQTGFLRSSGLRVHTVSSPGVRPKHQRRLPMHRILMLRRISPLSDIRAVIALWALIRRIGPAIVHTHTPKSGLLGILAAKIAGVNVRIYTMNGLVWQNRTGWLRRFLKTTERLACRLATDVFAVSASLRDLAIRENICPATKIRVLGSGSSHGVDLERFDPAVAGDGMVLRERLNIPRDALVIAFMGRLVREKGVADLAVAWRTIREEFPGAYLLVVGDEEDGDPVDYRILSELRARPRVRLVSALHAEMPMFYAAIDICVLPSWREGLPNVLLEAAAMKRPAVATKIPGCIDAIQDGTTGLLVEMQNPAALSMALGTLLGDTATRVRMGENARAFVASRFSERDVSRNLLAEYRRLLAIHWPDFSAKPEGDVFEAHS